MTGKRFLIFLAHHGIPASCYAQRLGCSLTAIKKLQSYEKVPKHYVNKLINEFGSNLSCDDLKLLEANNMTDIKTT